jgi:hypothetical protein
MQFEGHIKVLAARWRVIVQVLPEKSFIGPVCERHFNLQLISSVELDLTRETFSLGTRP